MNTLSKTLLVLGIVGLTAGLILYFHGTVMVDARDVPAKIDKATHYTEQGLFSRNYYSQVQATPTSAAEPNMNYLLVLDNGIIKQNYKVSWSQLELDICKLKTVTNKISQDEYTALGMKPSYTTKMFEVRPQRQMPYLVPGIVLLVAFISYYVLSKLRGVPSSPCVLSQENVTGATPVFESTAPLPGQVWPVNEHGQAIPPESEPQGEPTTFVDSSEFIKSPSPLESFEDFQTNQRINRLIKEKRITIEEAKSVRQQTCNMDFLERKGFLSAIEHRFRKR